MSHENNDILDVLPCAYVAFNDAGVIVNCNRGLEEFVGYSRDELAGKSIENIFTLATRIFYNTHFFPLIKLHSKASEIFLSLKDRNNAAIPVLANAQRILHAENGIIHCTFMRVEERKKYEDELLKARRVAETALQENRQLNDLTKSLETQAIELDKQYRRQLAVNENLLKFSKVVSHDLQEPIRKIRLFADLIAKNSDDQHGLRNQALCEKIDSSAERLRLLTDSLRQYIAIDSEKNNTLVDLNHIVEAACKKATEFRKFSEFVIEKGELPKVEAYETQLELMFFHLIDNAIQFRHKDRKLVVKINALTFEENLFRATPHKYKFIEYVKISVEDNGVGFPNQYRDYIFEFLTKLDGKTTGLGVGLSLVKKVVDNHFGSLSVTSEVNKGTRFEIEIPTQMGLKGSKSVHNQNS